MPLPLGDDSASSASPEDARLHTANPSLPTTTRNYTSSHCPRLYLPFGSFLSHMVDSAPTVVPPTTGTMPAYRRGSPSQQTHDPWPAMRIGKGHARRGSSLVWAI